MTAFSVALFHNTSAVMRAEKLLQMGGVSVKLIPTPRELSSDCGLAVRFKTEDKERAIALLNQAHVEVAGVRDI